LFLARAELAHARDKSKKTRQTPKAAGRAFSLLSTPKGSLKQPFLGYNNDQCKILNNWPLEKFKCNTLVNELIFPFLVISFFNLFYLKS
jgi:hypothetical protein